MLRQTGRQKPELLSRPKLARLLAIACLLSAAEFLATLSLGRFLDWGRAEPLLFLAFRPWTILAASIAVSSRPVGERAILYALMLLLAFVCESLFLLTLGGSDPWSGGALGLLAGSGLAMLFDLLIQLGRRFGRVGLVAAALAASGLLILPGPLRPYEALVLGAAPRPARGPKPELMLFTALPIIWGETGPFDPDARPASSYRYLGQEFAIRPLDMLDAANLTRGKLLLVAQPRALAASEFAALDAWVRGGGRALILTDPALIWPSELPLGDIRRPPAIGLLGPLLGNWGLRMEPRPASGPVVEKLYGDWSNRRLVVAGTGRFMAADKRCQVWLPATFAHCRIGNGQAWLAADADLMNDALWSPPVGSDDLRRRSADNPLVVADWLDSLAGLKRERIAAPIQWIDDDASPTRAVLTGLLPLLLAGVAGVAGVAGLALARVRRG